MGSQEVAALVRCAIVTQHQVAPPTGGHRSVGTALQLLGDRWTLLLLRDAFLLRRRRFHEWRDALGISDAVLASRLADLVDAGVLERRQVTAIHVEYWLTESGLDVWRSLVAMWTWERRWVELSRRTQPAPIHLACGRRTEPVLVCGHCRLATTPRDTTARLDARAADFMTDSSLRRRRSSKLREPTDPALLFPETMALIGDRTAELILALAFLGARRFSDFERQLEVSPSLLTDRLRRLVRQGVLSRRRPSTGGHAEYRLTPKGMDFFPVTIELVSWAQRWFGDAAAPALEVTHVACGQTFDPQLACDQCDALLERTHLGWAAAREEG